MAEVETSPTSPAYEVSQSRADRITEFQRGFLETNPEGFAQFSNKRLLEYAQDNFPGGINIQKALDGGATEEQILSQTYGFSPKGPLAAGVEGVQRGFLEGTPTAAGGMMGYEIGLAASPYVTAVTGPVGGAATIMLTTGLGAASGYLFGDTVSDAVLGEDPKFAPSSRPYAEGGYTAGSALPLPFSTYMFTQKLLPNAASLADRVTRMVGVKETPLQAIQRTALEKPGKYMAIEGAAIGQAAVAGGIAEANYPGDVTLRFLAEAGAGSTSPFVVGSIEKIGSSLKNTAQMLTKSGRKQRQANTLAQYMIDNQGNPKAVLDRLRGPDAIKQFAEEMGVTMPANRPTANIAFDEITSELQNALAKDKTFGPTMRKALAQDYKALTNLVEVMDASGDPRLLAEASRLRERLMEGTIIQRLSDALDQAKRINKSVAPTKKTDDGTMMVDEANAPVTDTRAAMEAGRTIEAVTAKVIRETRKAESQFYDRIDGSEQIDVPIFTQVLDELETEAQGSIQFLPPEARRFIFNSRGINPETAEIDFQRIDVLNNKITKSQDTINDVQAQDPSVKTYFDDELNPSLQNNTLEGQLEIVQNAISRTENIDLSTSDMKAPRRNRLLNALRNKAKIINNQIEIRRVKERVEPAVPKSRVDELSEQVSEGALNEFNKRIRMSKARPGVSFNADSADDLRRVAKSNDAVADRQMVLYNQDPKDGVSFKETADKLREEADLFRARADDIENPVDVDAPAIVGGAAFEPVTLKDVMLVKSRLQDKAREFSGDSQFYEARVLNKLAGSLVDDIGVKSGGVRQEDGTITFSDSEALTANQTAIRDAYNFSRKLNDVFTRAFPAKIVERDSSGARHILPELLHKALFSGGGDETSLKFDQMNQSMVFLANELGAKKVKDLGLSATLGTMTGAQETLMRVAFEELIDPTTGRVSVEALNKFKKDYRNVLFLENGAPRFPDVVSDLASVESAENLLRRRIRETGDPRAATPAGSPLGNNVPPEGFYQKELANQISYKNSLGADVDPMGLVGSVIANPGTQKASDVKGFKRLITIARRADATHPGASDGLRSMVLQKARMYATSAPNKKGETVFNFAKYKQFLTTPMTPGKPSPLDLMRQEGLVDEGFALRLTEIMNVGVQSQRALTGAGEALSLGDVMPKSERLFQLSTRLMGLRAGRAATQAAPGQGQGLAEPMIAASEFQRLLIDTPDTLVFGILEKGALDPKFYADVLEKGLSNNPRSIRAANRKLKAALINSGFIAVTEEERSAPQKEVTLPPEDTLRGRNLPRSLKQRTQDVKQRADELINQTSSVQPVPAQRVAPPTSTLASAAPPPPPPAAPAPSGPVNRQQYAALFPNDIASSMIRQQGIGSLMG